MKIFDGKQIRNQLVSKLKEEVELLDLKPSLAIIWAGEDFATARYIEAKQRAAEKIGIHFDLVKYSNRDKTARH